MNIGVIQGRLSPPIEGFQERPKDWQREFGLLDQIGLTHIEWVVTKRSFDNNPLFSSCISGLPISSVCADFVVQEGFLNQTIMSTQLSRLCQAVLKNGLNHITIPLLEESSVEDKGLRNEFIAAIELVMEMFPDIVFLIEPELSIQSTADLLGAVSSLRLTYDTGNITSLGISNDDYIREFSERILHIHLKDRTNRSGVIETVLPGSGDTPFQEIFCLINELCGQSVAFTIQTARGPCGCEIQTVSEHLNYFRSLWNE